jgi:signal transduction histidine kinase
MNEQDMNRVQQEWAALISDMAHELLTPLHSIRGYISLARVMIEREDFDREKILKFLKIAEENVSRLGNLVDDVRDISRLEARTLKLQVEPLRIDELVSKVAVSLQPVIETKGLNLTIEVPPDLPEVWGDQSRIVQVLSNLISNAYRYTPEGGRIAITAEWIDDSVQVDVPSGPRETLRPFLPRQSPRRPASGGHRSWPLHHQVYS